jgi:hypothetical protein
MTPEQLHEHYQTMIEALAEDLETGTPHWNAQAHILFDKRHRHFNDQFRRLGLMIAADLEKSK